MKNSMFALPALLRSSIFAATASQSAFSVQDDLLAFPQFEVTFSDDFLLEAQAQARVSKNAQVDDDAPSHLEQYRPSSTELGPDSIPMEEVKMEYESMILDGQRYLCSIPQVKKSDVEQATNDTLSKAEEAKELARATEHGWQLLSGMSDHHCLYYISGWWSYKFCYNDIVRQFHQLSPRNGIPVFPPIEDPGVHGFTLGKYSGDTPDKPPSSKSSTARESRADVGELVNEPTPSTAVGELVQRGENKYLVQRMQGGTTCDLTGKDRRIEVQFHCRPQAPERISLVKEVATCAYLMVIQTPRLCNDVAFLPPQKDKPNAIKCSPIISEDDVEIYNEELKKLKAAEAEARIKAATAEAAAKILTGNNQPRQWVGDIEVGGHRLVPEGMKIEKSAIVGGGKETFVDTVASSDGKNRKVLPNKELEKLGLGDPKAVEELMKKLEQLADGQEWRLDVVDTIKGREYRGIIGAEEEKSKEGAKGDGEREEDVGSKEEFYHEEL